VLRDFAAAGRQLLVFTCHDHVVKAFKAIKADVRRLGASHSKPKPLDAPVEIAVEVEEARPAPAPEASIIVASEPIVEAVASPDPVGFVEVRNWSVWREPPPHEPILMLAPSITVVEETSPAAAKLGARRRKSAIAGPGDSPGTGETPSTPADPTPLEIRPASPERELAGFAADDFLEVEPDDSDDDDFEDAAAERTAIRLADMQADLDETALDWKLDALRDSFDSRPPRPRGIYSAEEHWDEYVAAEDDDLA
jgi:hypothetical protein